MNFVHISVLVGLLAFNNIALTTNFNENIDQPHDFIPPGQLCAKYHQHNPSNHRYFHSRHQKQEHKRLSMFKKNPFQSSVLQPNHLTKSPRWKRHHKQLQHHPQDKTESLEQSRHYNFDYNFAEENQLQHSQEKVIHNRNHYTHNRHRDSNLRRIHKHHNFVNNTNLWSINQKHRLSNKVFRSLPDDSHSISNVYFDRNVQRQHHQQHQLRHWPVKREAIVEGDVILGGLMMVHSREDTIICGPIMPQGGIQALEAMLYTIDKINEANLLPNITIGTHILDDCDKDSYGLEMAVDFIKGEFKECLLKSIVLT